MVGEEAVVSKVTWKAAWAGMFMIAGVQILMQLFGIAIGVSAIGPSRDSVQGVSLWQGIWAIISTLSAFFFGGWVASSLIAPVRRADGVLMGVVLWAFGTTLGIILVSAGLFGAIGIGRSLLVPQGSPSGMAELHSGATIGAAWATFATILLALVCAVGGGLLGSKRAPHERRERRLPVGSPLGPIEPNPIT